MHRDDEWGERDREIDRRLTRDGERERRFLRQDLRRRLNRDDLVERSALGAKGGSK